MKSISVFLLLTILHRGQAAPTTEESYAIIEELFESLGVDGCDAITENTQVLCEVVQLLPDKDLCLQDLVNYLIDKCEWDCELALKYINECGCFEQILQAIGWEAEEMFQVVKSNYDCKINAFMQWAMCEYGIHPQDMLDMLNGCPFCFEPAECSTTAAPTTTTTTTLPPTTPNGPCTDCFCELHLLPCTCSTGTIYNNPSCVNDWCSTNTWMCKADGLWHCC